MFKIRTLFLLLAPSLLLLAGCQASPKMSWQIMAAQPRYEVYEENTFFPDGLSMRPQVPNTVARGYVNDNQLLTTGKTGSGQDAKDADTFPFPVTQADIERGRERYNIYCVPCHDPVGTGNGVVVQRGYAQPPSLHDQRLRDVAVGHFYDVMTNGWGRMPRYATQISVRDRWNIAAYIRALQLSQNAKLDDVPAEQRGKLQGGQ